MRSGLWRRVALVKHRILMAKSCTGFQAVATISRPRQSSNKSHSRSQLPTLRRPSDKRAATTPGEHYDIDARYISHGRCFII